MALIADQQRLSIAPEVESVLAEHAFYQVHLRLLLKNSAVREAMVEYELTRRQMEAETVDVLAMLGTINRAQSLLIAACKKALSPYPNLQANLNNSHLQLVVVDALCALVRI